jgi:DNA-binding response OmpR family regulator
MKAPKVLIIEDKDLYAASLASQFQRWGFRVQILPDFNPSEAFVDNEMPGLVVANSSQKKTIA